MYQVLVVDDEKLTLDYLKLSIPKQDSDWEVIYTCLNGMEALDWLQTNTADLIITDIKMPEMSGLQLCEKIKLQNPAQKIVILSGYDEFKFAQEAIRYGVKRYLLKPISLPELKNTLSQIKTALQEEQSEKVSNDSSRHRLPPADSVLSKNSIVAKAETFIHKNYAQPISLALVADELDISPNYLSALFHKELGESYSKYVTRVRMEHAVRLMKEHPEIKIYEIPDKVGYVNVKHFSYVFKQMFGMTPGEYQQNLW